MNFIHLDIAVIIKYQIGTECECQEQLDSSCNTDIKNIRQREVQTVIIREDCAVNMGREQSQGRL